MLEDFKRALARVQNDYGFYIGCQANPAVALAGFDLSPDERTALINPEKLADQLRRGVGVINKFSITIKICGTHDWVNRAAVPGDAAMEDTDREARIASEVTAIGCARTGEERTHAVVRLMELIG